MRRYCMKKAFLMGNEAIAMGAIAAGVNLVAGYPGTPSTEVLETAAKHNDGSIYVEWSTNEKAGMEVAAGAAYSGARSMVTMKQVGLNVASDPLMSLEYIGVKGGMVVMVADDPGPISSQTEQDTRHYAAFAKLPCFDPSSVQEAYDMIQEAFELSERYGTPVFFRPTTRVCHGYASIDIKKPSEYHVNKPDGFKRDTMRWVIFPRLSYANHKKIEARNAKLSEVFSDYKRNFIERYNENNDGVSRGIATHGISYTYTQEALDSCRASFAKKDGDAETEFPDVLKISTPFPFPEELAVKFLTGKKEVLCIEELDPVIERQLIYLCGKYNLNVKIRGKLTHDVNDAGENTIDSVKESIAGFMGWQDMTANPDATGNGDDAAPPQLPVRPPVLCAGCPHRASFYAVKEAMRGKNTIFCGDIGCYTLGNAMPLDMVDTCLCMGAGLGIAQGVGHIEPDKTCFAFVGDSTFFASAITGVVNAVYNKADMILVVLDNSTTAMTGHQPHPGTGHRMMELAANYEKPADDIANVVSIENVLRGIGVAAVETVNPLDHKKSVEIVKKMAGIKGVKAIIFKSPCVVMVKHDKPKAVEKDKCVSCKKCINSIGCPAIILNDGRAFIDASSCTGCGLCAQICPVGAIV